jgi:pyruvate dehydrogenase E1 component beta subunit
VSRHEALRSLTYLQAVREALSHALESDDRVFLMGEEIGQYGGVFRATDGLQKLYGTDRVRDTPICEASLVGTAVGAAIVGRRPIVEIMFMDFIASAMDALANHAAKIEAMSGGQLSVPLVVRTQGGSGTRHGAQHSQMLESWLTHVPGLLVALPSTPGDVLGLYRRALQIEVPIVIVEHRLLYRTKGWVTDPVVAIPFGEAVVRHPGDDVTIVATSHMTVRALEAAHELDGDGVSAEIIDPRTLVPLDVATIVASVRRTGRILVVHEEVTRSGSGAEIIAAVLPHVFDDLKAAPARLAGHNTPLPFGAELEASVVPQPKDIWRAAMRLVRGA